jgi:hypothetical protein
MVERAATLGSGSATWGQTPPGGARPSLEALRHTEAGRQILLEALEVMSEIEADYAGLIGASDAAELKRVLAALLAQIDPAGALYGA